MAKPITIKWLAEPEPHDYPAAESYLGLLFPAKKAKNLAKEFKAAAITNFKAKDIFRASKLSLLGISNSHVEDDRRKIRAGSKLSPVLLVRSEDADCVVVADGYHRLCAVYSFDEDALIPCKIV